jgi:hypothetical protein
MEMDIAIARGSVDDKLLIIDDLLGQLTPLPTRKERLDFLNSLPQVQAFLEHSKTLRSFLRDLSSECDYAIKSILAIGQGPIVFNALEMLDDKYERLRSLLHTLLDVEDFYAPIGGIIGYYHTTLRLLREGDESSRCSKEDVFHYPPMLDLSDNGMDVSTLIKEGIKALSQMAEVYPIGGAGDRLNLQHPVTQIPLPVAQLEFEGFYLLERLIRDLQAREYLHWKLFGVALETPVVFMGSHEKNNVEHILEICQEHEWFGRSPDNFLQLVQPLVPQITDAGNFSLSEFLKLTLKPGGHGVIWKLMFDEGVFDWLRCKGRQKILVRQINNPVSGLDDTLLAFAGIGSSQSYHFGFVACERVIGGAEGMLVCKQSHMQGNDSAHTRFKYVIENIEYTNFKSKGIVEEPKSPGSCYSQYPANTNILFADLLTIEDIVRYDPLPGLLINMKKKAPFIDEDGSLSQVPAGRLESSMQNIADNISYYTNEDFSELHPKALPTYVMYTHRNKALSVAKNAFVPGKSLKETPEGCFLTLMENARDLLVNYCRMTMPPLDANESSQPDAAGQPLPYIVRYAPVLGPLYAVIAQKIQGGSLALGSELHLELAELDMRELALQGSTRIIATHPFGTGHGPSSRVTYNHEGGKCELYNVTVVNQGINHASSKNCYWKGSVDRDTCLEIILHGNGEFLADSVTFNGPHTIEVPDGHRVEARMCEGKIVYRSIIIDRPTWYWDYVFAPNDEIALLKVFT